MKTFKELVFKPLNKGVHAKVFFNNGYGASIVKGPYTYGGKKGLYELAVLSGNEEKWHLEYGTKITDDVIGHQSEEDITKLLSKISKL